MAMMTSPSSFHLLRSSSSSSSSSSSLSQSSRASSPLACKLRGRSKGSSSSSSNNNNSSSWRLKCYPASRAEIKEEEELASTVASKSEGQYASTTSLAADFKAPEPKRFYVRGDKLLDIVGCSLALPFRLGSGALAQGYTASWVPEAEFPADSYSSFTFAGRKLKETSNLGARPAKPIEIYEFEGCPFCRKVREIVSILDLDVLYYPCPQGGPNFRPKAIKLGGKKQFPYMVDPNTDVSMYESDDIIKYLVEKYGDGKVPVMLSLGIVTTLTAGLAMIARTGKGSRYVPSKLPEKPLELWAYEASPFCKIVREVLVELELPHIYHSTPRGSSKRYELFQRVGHFQVPYLEDPNTGVKTFESASIIEYLQATYAISNGTPA